MWFVYILRCSDASLYTGISNNPGKRFLVHLKGKGGGYTRSHRPVCIVYLEKKRTKSAALKREYEIKSWKREEKMMRLMPTSISGEKNDCGCIMK